VEGRRGSKPDADRFRPLMRGRRTRDSPDRLDGGEGERTRAEVGRRNCDAGKWRSKTNADIRNTHHSLKKDCSKKKRCKTDRRKLSTFISRAVKGGQAEIGQRGGGGFVGSLHSPSKIKAAEETSMERRKVTQCTRLSVPFIFCQNSLRSAGERGEQRETVENLGG